MRIVPTRVPDVLVIEPDVFRDERGWFFEVFNAAKFRAHGLPDGFVQDNHSRSVRDTVRGLHAQRRRPQGKLVRVLAGEVFDVCVDLRRGSRTYREWVGVRLTADEHRLCWIPPGFAHGFAVLSDVAEIEYKCTALYDPSDEIGLRWDDPDVGIEWPVKTPLLSPKDRQWPTLRALEAMLADEPSAALR